MSTATAAKPAPTAAQLAADLAAAAVPAMLLAVKNAKKIGMGILGMCLLVTFPHTGEFLASLPHVGWFGWVIAALQDAGLMALAQIVQTPGLAPEARKRAAIVLGALGVEAATLQAVAPGAFGIKALFVSVVGLGLAIKWVIAAVKPDFEAIAAREQHAAAQAAALAPARKTTARKCAPGCACGKHRKTAKPAAKKATRKPATTRKPAAQLATTTDHVTMDAGMLATLDAISNLATVDQPND